MTALGVAAPAPPGKAKAFKPSLVLGGRTRFFTTSLLRAVLLFLAVSLSVFGLSKLLPGDPAVALAGESATPEVIEAIRKDLGYDQALVTQYLSWFTDVLRGDFGNSLYYNAPVTELVAGRLPVTISLTLVSILVAVIFGLLAGMLAAVRRGTVLDKATTVFSTAGIATPNFWVGLLLIIVFSSDWDGSRPRATSQSPKDSANG